MKCDVCGYDLTDEDGYSVVGMQISLLGAHPERKRVENLFGKNNFNFCCVCQLKALGVKKKTKTGEP